MYYFPFSKVDDPLLSSTVLILSLLLCREKGSNLPTHKNDASAAFAYQSVNESRQLSPKKLSTPRSFVSSATGLLVQKSEISSPVSHSLMLINLIIDCQSTTVVSTYYCSVYYSAQILGSCITFPEKNPIFVAFLVQVSCLTELWQIVHFYAYGKVLQFFATKLWHSSGHNFCC